MVTALYDVSETARERETFRYDALTISTAGLNSAEPAKPIPSAFLLSTPDPGLTAFAQLGLHRLRAARSMISLFDRKFQHIVAEALRPASRPSTGSGEAQEQNWFNGLTFERSTSVCEHVVTAPASTQSIPGTQLGLTPADIPVSVINRLDSDPRFCHIQDPGRQFYAGVPIRTPKGINIGVYCVFDDQPRPEGLDPDEIRFIREISRVIMDYLESKRSHEWYRREQRMVRGLGSFVKGQATLWNRAQSDSDQLASIQDLPGMIEGSLNKKLQPALPAGITSQQAVHFSPDALMPDQSHPALPVQNVSKIKDFATIDAVPNLASTAPTAPPLTQLTSYSTDTKVSGNSNNINRVFSKAANVIREALEVEGVLFLDADVRSYGGLVGKASSEVPSVSELRNPSSTSSSSGDESTQSQNGDSPSDGNASCDVLGFATSDVSSIVGDASPAAFAEARERFLQRLLRRYPQGHIWNLEADGTVSDHSTGSDGDESPLQERKSFHSSSYPGTTDGQDEMHNRRKSHLKPASLMTKMFPGARSVALVPLWDAQSGRVFAGVFTWTRTPTRTFSEENELTYLRVFGLTTMAEVARLKMRLADKTKTDILGSISHELRSPLHGLVGSVELLRHTALDAMQNGILSAIESSGRTLLDTIDHLLDFAKINATKSSKSRRKDISMAIRPSDLSVSDSHPTPLAPIQLDLLVEEVVESVLAGSSYLTRSEIPSTSFVANQSTHSTKSSESSAPPQHSSRPAGSRAAVQTYLDIDHAASWAFRMHPGAFRRIVMNLVGNSLKFTTSGFIRVSLRQESLPKRSAVAGTTQAVLTVSDSGKGMGEEYLRKHLFTAFSQEDQFAAGTGLGLSLVRHTTKAMGGTIEVMSKVGQGTTITVRLPLVQVADNSTNGDEADFWNDARTLSGQRVQLCGFERMIRSRESFRADDNKQKSQYQLMESICQDTLQMNVVPGCNTNTPPPDVVVCIVGDGLACSDLQSPEQMSRCPYVFVCDDLAYAHRVLEEKSGKLPRVYEICSQPIGPRKLARALLSCRSRWNDIRGSEVNTTFVPTLAPEDLPPQLSTGAKTSEGNTGTLTLRFAQVEQTRQAPTTTPSSSNQIESVLPFERPPIPLLPIATPTSVTHMAESVAVTSESRKPILIVDDNAINLKVMAAYLTKLKHTCITAVNGLEALQIFSDRPSDFSCVLTDISMPVMDGLESTRRIREFERTMGLKSVVVIALTGLSGTDIRQDAHASGVDLFLTRPLTLQGLKVALTKLGLT